MNLGAISLNLEIDTGTKGALQEMPLGCRRGKIG